MVPASEPSASLAVVLYSADYVLVQHNRLHDACIIHHSGANVNLFTPFWRKIRAPVPLFLNLILFLCVTGINGRHATTTANHPSFASCALIFSVHNFIASTKRARLQFVSASGLDNLHVQIHVLHIHTIQRIFPTHSALLLCA